jgi:hypothetical protein
VLENVGQLSSDGQLGKVVLPFRLIEDGEEQSRIDRYPMMASERNEKFSQKQKSGFA